VEGDGIKPLTEGMVLLKATICPDSTVEGVKLLPALPYRLSSEKLQFEMLDGSVQEINLKKVKKVTLEQ
jgi:hypothetical protein